MQMLTTCEPIQEDVLIAPYPRLATVTAFTVSGISAPTATIASPKKPMAAGSSSKATKRFAITVTTEEYNEILMNALFTMILTSLRRSSDPISGVARGHLSLQSHPVIQSRKK